MQSWLRHAVLADSGSDLWDGFMSWAVLDKLKFSPE